MAMELPQTRAAGAETELVGQNRSIDARSIVTLIVFFVVSECISLWDRIVD